MSIACPVDMDLEGKDGEARRLHVLTCHDKHVVKVYREGEGALPSLVALMDATPFGDWRDCSVEATLEAAAVDMACIPLHGLTALITPLLCIDKGSAVGDFPALNGSVATAGEDHGVKLSKITAILIAVRAGGMDLTATATFEEWSLRCAEFLQTQPAGFKEGMVVREGDIYHHLGVERAPKQTRVALATFKDIILRDLADQDTGSLANWGTLMMAVGPTYVASHLEVAGARVRMYRKTLQADPSVGSVDANYPSDEILHGATLLLYICNQDLWPDFLWLDASCRDARFSLVCFSARILWCINKAGDRAALLQKYANRVVAAFPKIKSITDGGSDSTTWAALTQLAQQLLPKLVIESPCSLITLEAALNGVDVKGALSEPGFATWSPPKRLARVMSQVISMSQFEKDNSGTKSGSEGVSGDGVVASLGLSSLEAKRAAVSLQSVKGQEIIALADRVEEGNNLQKHFAFLLLILDSKTPLKEFGGARYTGEKAEVPIIFLQIVLGNKRVPSLMTFYPCLEIIRKVAQGSLGTFLLAYITFGQAGILKKTYEDRSPDAWPALIQLGATYLHKESDLMKKIVSGKWTNIDFKTEVMPIVNALLVGRTEIVYPDKRSAHPLTDDEELYTKPYFRNLFRALGFDTAEQSSLFVLQERVARLALNVDYLKSEAGRVKAKDDLRALLESALAKAGTAMRNSVVEPLATAYVVDKFSMHGDEVLASKLSNMEASILKSLVAKYDIEETGKGAKRPASDQGVRFSAKPPAGSSKAPKTG